MNLLVFWVVIVSLFAFGVATRCKYLPKVRHDDSQDTLLFRDSWRVVVSSFLNTDRCIHLAHLGYRNGLKNYATGLLINYKNGSHYAFSVRTNKNLDLWRANAEIDPKTPDSKFMKLWADYVKEAYCLYECDKYGNSIASLRCVATNKEGFEAVKKMLANYANSYSPLPFVTNPVVVWDDDECSEFSSRMPDHPFGFALHETLPPKSKINDDNIGVNGKPDNQY